VRKLAQRTNQFVMTHMTLLESSGIVDFAALPTAPPPASATGGSANAAQAQAAARTSTSLEVAGAPVLSFVVVALASAAISVFLFRQFMPGSRRSYRRPRARYYES
jgi:hypothetical protein